VTLLSLAATRTPSLKRDSATNPFHQTWPASTHYLTCNPACCPPIDVGNNPSNPARSPTHTKSTGLSSGGSQLGSLDKSSCSSKHTGQVVPRRRAPSRLLLHPLSTSDALGLIRQALLLINCSQALESTAPPRHWALRWVAIRTPLVSVSASLCHSLSHPTRNWSLTQPAHKTARVPAKQASRAPQACDNLTRLVGSDRSLYCSSPFANLAVIRPREPASALSVRPHTRSSPDRR
jgi:hypothetical protein